MNHEYLNELSSLFYSRVKPTERPKEYVKVNEKLLSELNLNIDEIDYDSDEIIAMAYSGHQFGYFTRLGDGRAALLGDVDGLELHLKGSGKTPYSRGGDGKATLGSMLREYLISEAMYNLNVPTTRNLFVAKTGNAVIRNKVEDGAVSLRLAKTHVRFGTFGYASEMGKESVKELLNYVSNKLYDGVSPFDLLKRISEQGAKLMAKWMSVGFIHGVMNTDNMSLAVETIDYGPCAFMDIYNPETVFSSIDTIGRYKYSNQPKIYQWNLARFAEYILDVLLEEVTKEEIEEVISNFSKLYEEAFEREFFNKLGIEKPEENDHELIYELLNIMYMNKMDFTNTFYKLTIGEYPEELKEFVKKWESKCTSRELMEKSNPVVIPRNEIVEKVIKSAESGNYKPFEEAIRVFSDPYNYKIEIDEKYKTPMQEKDIIKYKTYCGT
ncbi:MAG: protein adenylyltransferase SelO family protein [Peptoniphilus sp.]|uniref:protein adenylyltransferase SelO family protein n=1 Tax=Peptoniphilus sp. TaxID=1971214 RepID=UPI002A74B74C|nr:protein adenylyltransferase SelO family protein [Peptoniphilus sp.]MDY2986033.1 protein adenylyltransferase SelO family protein [Peptoniphilus sp.]